MTELPGQNPEDYELVFPFKCVKSAGGPWDDDSFVAGARLGHLMEKMRQGVPAIEAFIEPDLRETLDLAAMNAGYSTYFGPVLDTDEETGEWMHVSITTNEPF